jgi:uncharacterized cupin superfamily protein
MSLVQADRDGAVVQLVSPNVIFVYIIYIKSKLETRKETPMLITRIYSGPDGESHFEDIDFPMKAIGPGDSRSDTLPATGIFIRATQGEFEMDWHNAPRRQLLIMLKGQSEVTVGDGTKRILSPGDMMLAEDVSGRGHITRAVNDQPRMSVFVTLD